MLNRRLWWCCVALVAATAQGVETPYDPLAVSGVEPTVWDNVVSDATRHRDIPIRVYLPADSKRAPIVFFSHGLGGSREGSAFLGMHWAKRGYVAVFLQHPGSDASVWVDKPKAEIMAALEKAANVDTFLDRVKDVPAVIDQLTAWNSAPGHVLNSRLELSKIAMTGHSFGAVTTQAVSGQTMPMQNVSFTDPRITSAVVMSPSLPKRGSPAKAFATVKIPWLLMTGTLDSSPIGNATAESRTQVFPLLPPGHKYEVVFDKAAHSVFTERSLGLDAPRNPKHHPAIQALTTAFFDATLRDDAAAKKWLDGAGPRSVLEPADRWQKK